jgi:hypothetical protein
MLHQKSVLLVYLWIQVQKNKMHVLAGNVGWLAFFVFNKHWHTLAQNHHQ